MTRLAKQQSGAVLLIALVILGITTLLGVAVMQGSTMETKMAINNQERQQAFNAAEAALIVAEEAIQNGALVRDNLRDTCDPAVTPPCFDNVCSDGYCFDGDFGATDQQPACKVWSGTPLTDGFWGDTALDVWNSGNAPLRHQTITNMPGYGGAVSAKYIIEFQCFTDQIPDAMGNQGLVKDDLGDVMYRITARGTSISGRLEVMLQTTYRMPNPP